jgi:hypothetical protein
MSTPLQIDLSALPRAREVARRIDVSPDHTRLIEAIAGDASVEECRRLCETGVDIDFADALYATAIYSRPALRQFIYARDPSVLTAALRLAYRLRLADEHQFERLLALVPCLSQSPQTLDSF